MDRSSIPPRSNSVSNGGTPRNALTLTASPHQFTLPLSGQSLRRAQSDGIPALPSTLLNPFEVPDRTDHTALYPHTSTTRSEAGETWRDLSRRVTDYHGERFSAASPHEAAGRADSSRIAESFHRPQVGECTSSAVRKRVPSSSAEEHVGKRRSSSSLDRSTALHPIGLTSNPQRALPPRQGVPNDDPSSLEMGASFRPETGQRQPSTGSIVLPPWQPDDEVFSCPVCQTPFTIWYRRHHCRKCGRVVCGNCSPHRITIPRQFIVQPPLTSGMSSFVRYSSSPEESRAPQPRHDALSQNLSRRSSAAMSGGEVVRVCNPCVPDPNFSPPPQSLQSQSAFPVPNSTVSLLPPNASSSISGGVLGREPPPIPERSSSMYPAGQAFTLQRPPSERVAPGSGTSAQTPFQHLSPRLLQMRPTVASSSTAPTLPSLTSGRSAARSGIASAHRQYHLSPTGLSHPLGYRRTSDFDPLQPSAPPPIPPPRQMKEEDECPVCGRELPPKGINGDESAREHHVEDCIRLYSASSSSVPAVAPRANTPASTDATGQAGNAMSIASSGAAGPGTAATPSNSVPAPMMLTGAMRPMQHRMLVYHATEKDCVGEDGDGQECVICFEEFEEGDEMGRLDCLCKFHRACIKQWWSTKGVGSCPTHQLHQ